MPDPAIPDPAVPDPIGVDPTRAERSPDPDTPPQIIPRPPDARPGAPAPWATISSERRRGLTLRRVRGALEAAGQWGEAPPEVDDGVVEVVDPAAPVVAAVPSAVLVALFEEAGEARVLLTRRASGLRAHRGEVSFPGGRVDAGEDAPMAALREAEEEVALDRRLVRAVGWLQPVRTFTSGSLVMPVVATIERRPALVPSPAEVERAFDVALADLATDGAFHEELWPLAVRRAGGSVDAGYPVWFFAAAGETIWGATARVLVELVTLVLGASGDPGPGR